MSEVIVCELNLKGNTKGHYTLAADYSNSSCEAEEQGEGRTIASEQETSVQGHHASAF